MERFIYVDDCNPIVEAKILSDLGFQVVRRLPEKTWNVNDVMTIITDPGLILAVVNQIDEASLMEISLLHFMCKPILVTHRAIKEYPLVERTVDFIDYTSNLKDPASNFTTWFNWWDNQ